jgi:hypothetical protein
MKPRSISLFLNNIRSQSILRKALFMLFLVALAWMNSCNPRNESGQSGDDNISGVVKGPNGAEAGVWVIAETHDLPTRYCQNCRNR